MPCTHWNRTQRLAVGLLNGWHNASTSGWVTSSRDSKYAWITPWRQTDENPSPQAGDVAGAYAGKSYTSIPHGQVGLVVRPHGGGFASLANLRLALPPALH